VPLQRELIVQRSLFNPLMSIIDSVPSQTTESANLTRRNRRPLQRNRPEGDVGSATSSGIKSCIRCGHLLKERLKSNDDFGCSLTVASDEIEHLPDFFQIRRFSAQPV